MLIIFTIAMISVAIMIPIIGKQYDNDEFLTVLTVIPLFALIPSFQVLISSGIVNMFGTYGGGQIYSFLASARALGAFIPFAGLGFLSEVTLGEGEVPEVEKIYIWYYIACGCLALSTVAIVWINPTPLVKELDDENETDKEKETDDHYTR